MSLFLLPFSLFAMVAQNFEYTGTLCKFQGLFFTILVATQQLALLIISIDRNYAIMNSLRYPNVFTQTLCVSLITFTWLLAIVVSVPPALDSEIGRYTYHPAYFICTLDWSHYSGYLVVFIVIVFGLPISVQSMCYIRIFIAAVGHTKRTAKVNPWVSRSSGPQVDNENSTGSTGSSEAASSSLECKAVRTIFIIALAFVICWVPYFVESFAALRGFRASPTFSAAAICFLYSTGILNPLIYAFMNRVTRREIGRFVCGNRSTSESDEFASTSMSTHTSNWSSQNNKHRSRSMGVANNDMQTIVEENEESGVFGKDSIFVQDAATLHNLTETSTSPGRTSLSEKIRLQTDSHTAINSTEILVESEENLDNATSESRVKPSTSKEKSVTIGNTRVLGESHWKILHTDKFKEERKKVSSKQNASETYFAKPKRRKKRDCGSFLYFEHKTTDHMPTVSKTKREKRRPERFSVDHVQSVSLGKFPTFMKLKVSLNEADLQTINKVTVQSNIEIENKSFSGKLSESPRSDKGGDYFASTPTGTSHHLSPIFSRECWDQEVRNKKKHSQGSISSRKDSKTSRESNDTLTVPYSPRITAQGFRDRFRSEPFTLTLPRPSSVPSLASPSNSTFQEIVPDLVVKEGNESLDRYLD